MRKNIVVVGTSFGGFTGALELKDLLDNAHHITVIAPSPIFTFIPSLIWYPFGLRNDHEITFDVRPIYKNKGITFIQEPVLRFDTTSRLIITPTQQVAYDFLLIATGPKLDFDSVKGFGPDKHSLSIFSLDHAKQTKIAWEAFIKDPGPIVIGASQGASFFGAAYEFVFNVITQLKKQHIQDKSLITFITPEPFLTHFGVGGFGQSKAMCERLFDENNIQWRTNASIDEVFTNRVTLTNGESFDTKFTMIMPRFLGIDAIRNSPQLGDNEGFIPVKTTYQHKLFPSIFAAGTAIQIKQTESTAVPCGVPKTGYAAEQMAKVAAHNIKTILENKLAIEDDLFLENLPFEKITTNYIMDTGTAGILLLGDKMTGNKFLEFAISGPQSHWAKVAFEKYFLSSRRRGKV
jgi:sulfide:quinone oxidoreductase